MKKRNVRCAHIPWDSTKRNLRETLKLILVQPNVTAAGAITLIQSLVKKSTSTSDDDAKLLAQHVINDICQICDEPFGQLHSEDLSFGFGSCASHDAQKNHGAEGMHASMIDDTIQHMNTELDDDQLNTLGLHKREGEDFARCTINGEKLGPKFVEHCECKNALQVFHTLAARACSLQPKASKPHTWPLALGEEPLWDEEFVDGIMEGIEKSFLKLIESGKTSLPKVFLHVGETITPDDANNKVMADFNWDESDDDESDGGSCRNENETEDEQMNDNDHSWNGIETNDEQQHDHREHVLDDHGGMGVGV